LNEAPGVGKRRQSYRNTMNSYASLSERGDADAGGRGFLITASFHGPGKIRCANPAGTTAFSQNEGNPRKIRFFHFGEFP
jgi:hypothetical protein